MPETNIANPPKPISPSEARTSLSLNHNDRLIENNTLTIRNKIL
jgi:hypothetical protein